jgi:trans-aconitate methyltransferase
MDATFWNKVYSEKNEDQVSWFQAKPLQSIRLIEELSLSTESSVIDVGGGQSHLVDYFLEKGFQHITILDLSSVALDKLEARLGQREEVKTIACDVTTFKAQKKYDLWHDRAAFHFLTSQEQIDSYVRVVNETLAAGAFLVISTFSPTGPDKCSGLPIRKYATGELKDIFGDKMRFIKSCEDTHETPWGSTQDFVYCVFQKE